jgi:hypothetical protein
MSSEEICHSDSDGDKHTQDKAQHDPGSSRHANTAAPAVAVSAIAVSAVDLAISS